MLLYISVKKIYSLFTIVGEKPYQSYKTAKISIANIICSGLLERNSVDTANRAALGLLSVICISTVFYAWVISQ